MCVCGLKSYSVILQMSGRVVTLKAAYQKVHCCLFSGKTGNVYQNAGSKSREVDRSRRVWSNNVCFKASIFNLL